MSILLSIGSWLVTVFFSAVVVGVLARFGGTVRQFVVPLFFPLVVLAVAGFALFGTVQGRDLAVSLLGAPWTTLAMLALALFYWATGSWHTARLGLNRRFGTDPTRWNPRHRPWLRWLPRLLGAAAHLFAAISIGLAVPYVAPPAAKGTLLLLGALPVVLIVLGCLVMWLEDRHYLEARAALDAAGALSTDPQGADDPAVLNARAEVARRLRRARRRMWILIVFAAAMTVAMMVAEPWVLSRAGADATSIGLGSASAWVLISAGCFLLVVTSRKAIGEWLLGRMPTEWSARLRTLFEEADDKSATSSLVLAIALAGIAVLIAAWAWLSPLTLGHAGAMVIAFLAFGAYIAVIDLVRLLVASRLRVAAIVAILLLVAVGTSATNDFHRVRLCGDFLSPCGADAGQPPEPWTERRPTVEAAARAWYAQATRERKATGPVPLLIVATAGGGIRAAYWTATVLESLASEEGGVPLRRSLFAISGVSGGSVGALAAAAWLDGRIDEPPTRRLLAGDFLAPTLATFAFVDIPSGVLPEHRFGDRGWSLERAWEAASEGVLARPFLDFGRPGDALERGEPWRPLLLLNATHQATGKRLIAATVQVDSGVFLDSFDLHALLRGDVPASTAAHNSARFTYVSPAGALIARDGQSFGHVLDGGYFENFGALTALQLARAVVGILGADKVRPILLLISSDPGLQERDRVRNGNACDDPAIVTTLSHGDGDDDSSLVGYLSQLMAPAAGVLASREAHGIVATQELARWTCGVPGAGPGQPSLVHFAMCRFREAAEPPLGWVLSPTMRGQFEAMLGDCQNDHERNLVIKELQAAR